MKLITCFAFLICLNQGIIAQVDSIYDQGTYRSFILHLPAGYNPNIDYPLVLNFHGLGSSAFEQQLYSQFDDISDDEDFIVVYPDAINNSWDIFGATDVSFVSNLVDTLREKYSTNNCLFSMGMSQGGFLSYKLACELDKPISAIAVVTGGMTTFMQSSCNPTSGLPVVHFHGTNDAVVPYEGTFGIPPVEETFDWWGDENGCHDVPLINSIADVNTSDSSTVEKHRYLSCTDEAEVILYKVLNGGHTWPGAIPIPNLGVTNQDISASEIIGEFFTTHCDESTSTRQITKKDVITLSPNPATESFRIEILPGMDEISIYNQQGFLMEKRIVMTEEIEVDCSHYPSGIYLVKTLNNKQSYHHYLIVIK